MASPAPEKIADIIFNRREVYGFDADSFIRQAANRLTARALFELLQRLDDSEPDFRSQLSSLLSAVQEGEPSVLIGFASDVSSIPIEQTEPPQAPEAAAPVEYYLRLVFRNEDAAYYQFPFFPDLSAGYVCGAARKRAGAAQYIRIELTCPEALQTFIESCRSNPHFVSVEHSTADEFWRAPSNAV